MLLQDVREEEEMADSQAQATEQVVAEAQPQVTLSPVNPGQDRDFLYEQLSHLGTVTGDRKK